MRYNIYQGGIKINTIIADAAFVSSYCAKNGYTYEEAPFHPEPEPTPEPTVWDELAAAITEGVNAV